MSDHGHVRTARTADLPTATLGRIRELMDAAFPDDFSDDDWDHTLGGWHALVLDGRVPVSHAAVVSRTLQVADRSLSTGYVEGVATAPDREGAGLGSAVMSAIEDVIRAEFEFGALGTERHHFYERLGWERWRGRTWVRDGDELVRTADEDDGIMVLRFGPSSEVDLVADLVCEARPGDDW